MKKSNYLVVMLFMMGAPMVAFAQFGFTKISCVDPKTHVQISIEKMKESSTPNQGIGEMRVSSAPNEVLEAMYTNKSGTIVFGNGFACQAGPFDASGHSQGQDFCGVAAGNSWGVVCNASNE